MLHWAYISGCFKKEKGCQTSRAQIHVPYTRRALPTQAGFNCLTYNAVQQTMANIKVWDNNKPTWKLLRITIISTETFQIPLVKWKFHT
jgi:hypothetical protein